MKKIVFMMIVTVMTLGGACMAAEKQPPRVIVATFYPIRLAVMNIAAGIDSIQVLSLVDSAAGCLHDYQLTTRDMATLAKAEVLVANGAGLESFNEAIARKRPDLKIINASSGIDLLVLGGSTNAHLWVSPRRYMQQIDRIASELAAWDPGHAGQYRDNADKYRAKVESLSAKMQDSLKTIRSRKIITFHEAFPYFADEFKLEVAGVIEREPGASPSAAEMAALIQLIRKLGVKTLFVEPQYPAKIATAIAQETGAGIYTLDPVVSGPLTMDAYISIMERNLGELERALR